MEEQPGPPVIHRTKGSFAGSFLLSKNQYHRCRVLFTVIYSAQLVTFSGPYPRWREAYVPKLPSTAPSKTIPFFMLYSSLSTNLMPLGLPLPPGPDLGVPSRVHKKKHKAERNRGAWASASWYVVHTNIFGAYRYRQSLSCPGA